MELKLSKPICFFDLETTGIDITKDRIVEISILKVYPNGNKESKTWLVNPTIPIPKAASDVHGITDERVAGEPTFKELAKQIHNMIKDSDLAGYNSDRFDIPLLAEEMLRAEVDFDLGNRVSVDVQTIFHKMEQRTLSAAYKFYCGRKMEEDFEAHRADQDTEATYKVLMGELDKYNPETAEEPDRALANDMDVLAEFSKNNDNVDFAGRIVYKDMVDKDGKVLTDKEGKPRKQEVFNFGKYKGWVVSEVLKRDPGYYSWMLASDFTNNTKQVLTRIRLREFNNR